MTRRGLVLETGAVLAFYTCVTLAVFWPLPSELGSLVVGMLGESDAPGGIWWFSALQDTGYHFFGSTHFDRIAAPFGVDQPDGLNIQWLLVNYPTYLLTKLVGEVAAYNISVLSGFILSGASMYLLSRRLGCARLVAAWAGFVFLLFPWHVARAVAGHSTLVHLECFPILLLALVLVWERRTPLRLGLVGLAVLACWLTSGLFGVMAVILVPTAGVAAALVTRPRLRSLVTAASVTGAAAAASILVFVAAIPGGRDGGTGALRGVNDLSVYGLRVPELVVPASGNVLGDAVRDLNEIELHGSNVPEVTNYLGWTVITLALVWLGAVWRRRTTLSPALKTLTAAMVVAAATAFAFALPSPVAFLGHRWDRMPSLLLWERLPAFRAPSRWSLVILFAILVLAMLGLQALYDRFAAKRNPRVGIAALSAAAFALSFAELHISPGDVTFSADDVPPEYELVRGVSPGALAEYPLVSSDHRFNSRYLFWQREHGRALVNGARLGTHGEDVRRMLVNPGAPGVAGELAALGVSAIVTRPDTLSTSIGEPVPIATSAWGDGYRLVGRTPDGASVWEVVAQPAIVLVTLPGFTAPDYEYGRIVQYLYGERGAVEIQATQPVTGVLEMTIVSRLVDRRRVRLGGRTFVATPEGTVARVAVSVQEGLSTVELRIDAAPDEFGLAVTTPVFRTP